MFEAIESNSVGRPSQIDLARDVRPGGQVPTVDGFLDFLAENGEIQKHKWLESEKAGFDIGLAQAVSTWTGEHRTDWLDRRGQVAGERRDARLSGTIWSKIRLGVTLSLPDRWKPWPESYMSNLDTACRTAAELGYDAVELAIPEIDADAAAQVRRVQAEYGVGIAALGTGAGWIAHGLNLVNPSPLIRGRAVDYAAQMISLAAPIGAPVIVSSWMGEDCEFLDDSVAAEWLLEGLSVLAEFGVMNGVKILFEPLSRGDANDIGLLRQARHVLETIGHSNLGLVANQAQLADLREPGSDLLSDIEYIRYSVCSESSSHGGHLEFSALLALLDQSEFSGTLVAECLQ